MYFITYIIYHPTPSFQKKYYINMCLMLLVLFLLQQQQITFSCHFDSYVIVCVCVYGCFYVELHQFQYIHNDWQMLLCLITNKKEMSNHVLNAIVYVKHFKYHLIDICVDCVCKSMCCHTDSEQQYARAWQYSL